MLTSAQIDEFNPFEFNLDEEARGSWEPLGAKIAEFKTEFLLEIGACVQRALAASRPAKDEIEFFLNSTGFLPRRRWTHRAIRATRPIGLASRTHLGMSG